MRYNVSVSNVISVTCWEKPELKNASLSIKMIVKD